MDWRKGIISGIIAGIVYTIVGFALYVIPWTGAWYAATFPEMTTPSALWAMTASSFVMGLFMGIVYSVLNPAVPGKGVKKGINYGILVWLLAGLMWPIMATGFAPVSIWLTDLVAGLVTYAITGAAIALVYKKL